MKKIMVTGNIMKGPHDKGERQILKNSSVENEKRYRHADSTSRVSYPGLDKHLVSVSRAFYVDGQWIEILGSSGYIRVSLVYDERNKESITIIRDLGRTDVQGKKDLKDYLLSNFKVEIEETVPDLRLPMYS